MHIFLRVSFHGDAPGSNLVKSKEKKKTHFEEVDEITCK